MSYELKQQELDARAECKAAVLTLDYMSSEESETDKEGKTVYTVKTLTWQSQDLKKKKKSLNKHHMESLPLLVRRRH